LTITSRPPTEATTRFGLSRPCLEVRAQRLDDELRVHDLALDDGVGDQRRVWETCTSSGSGRSGRHGDLDEAAADVEPAAERCGGKRG
jgi:hypothetical protein